MKKKDKTKIKKRPLDGFYVRVVLGTLCILLIIFINLITNKSYVLGASTTTVPEPCSMWNIFCRLNNYFHMSTSTSSQSDTPTPSQVQTSDTVTGTTDVTALPLGDGKISSIAQKGYIYSCQTTFTGSGAETNGSWIHGDTWNKTQKITVQGTVTWPNAKFSIGTQGTTRVITGNGLPVGYATGTFPIAQTDPAYSIDKNPNSIKTQTIALSLPLNPQIGTSATCLGGGMIGIAIDGIPIFDGLDAGGKDAVAHEVQDACDGHPQQDGMYHYHGPSSCMNGVKEKNTLVGYALDGFGIYSMYDANGKEITNADLDACHGITSEITWNGKQVNMYHYVMTEEYPYTLGCFRGSTVIKTTPSSQQGGVTTQGKNVPHTVPPVGNSPSGRPLPPLSGMPGRPLPPQQ